LEPSSPSRPNRHISWVAKICFTFVGGLELKKYLGSCVYDLVKSAKIATFLVLSALLLGLSVSGGWEAVTMLVTVVGSLAAGLLYGRAWGWKGLAMSIAIAIIYSAAAFTGIIV
jgi:hypothetical protein